MPAVRKSPVLIGVSWLTVALLLTIVGTELVVAGGTWLDFSVYPEAGRTVLAGGDLYGFTVPDPHSGALLPFTYPPFAAILAIPLALVPLQVAGCTWALAQAALWAVMVLALMREFVHWRERDLGLKVATAALATSASLVSMPGMQGLVLGQASLAIAALVFLDFALVPPRWRGVLTGLAAAIKLTPLVFLVYFACTRRWRAFARAGLASGVATAVALAALPNASVQYWTHLGSLAGRVGTANHVANRSLLGALTRWGIDSEQTWLAMAVLIGAAALWRAVAHHRDGEEIAAVLTLGAMSTVVSPITWMHHMVWLPLAGVYLIVVGRSWTRWPGYGVLALMVIEVPLMAFAADDSPVRLLHATAVTILAVLVSVAGLPSQDGPSCPPSSGTAHVRNARSTLRAASAR